MDPEKLPLDLHDQGKLEHVPFLYTRFYSTRAFNRWRQMFTDSALVVRLDGHGGCRSMPIDAATALFRRAADRTQRLEETWDDVEIRRTGQLATIRARYRLASDADVREGTDLLTLVLIGGTWKIACLAYEQMRLTLNTGAPAGATGGPIHDRPSPPNLADLLTEQALHRPEAIAIRGPDRSWTFLELERLTWRCTALLADHGVQAGDTVALAFEDEAAGLVALLATARRGATVCWIPKAPTVLQAELIADAHARVLLCDCPGPAGTGAGLPCLNPDLSPPANAVPDPPLALRAAAPTAPWMVITGSGSTGKPKKIPISHRQFLAQQRIYNTALSTSPADVVACLLPLDSVVKRERLLDALLTGARVVLSPRQLTDPIGWLRQSAVSMLWTVVVQAEQLLSAPGAGTPGALPNLRALIVGSSTVSVPLRKRILSALTPALHVYYGMNEVGLVALAGPKDLLASAHSVGRPAPEVVVEIVDDRDRPLPAGQIGQVRLRSPGAANTYLDDDAASRRAFRQGWFYPGDLGRLDPDGRLDFCGRADHMMILNGINIYPEEIDRTVLACPGVADAATIPLPHPVHQDIPVCAVALAPGVFLKPEQIMRHARDRLGSRCPRAVVLLDRIPRNAQGKLIRAELRQQLLSRLQPARTQGIAQGAPAAGPSRNLTFDLMAHAASTPDATALTFGQERLSYRAVDDAVWRFSQHLHEHGIRAGDVLGLTVSDELTLVLTLLASVRLGATAYSIPRTATAVQREAMIARGRIKALATDQPERTDTGRPLPVSRAIMNAARPPHAVDILCASPQAPWLLITGSGTTGFPKLIPIAHAETAARSRMATQALGVTRSDCVASLSHFDFSTSKFRLHEALSVGAAYALGIWESGDPLVAIRQHHVSVIYGTVFHIETLLARLPPGSRARLANVRALELTASTVTDRLRARIRHILCPNLHVRYAINEAGPVCIASSPEVFDVAGTVGRPLPGVTVDVVDEHLQSVPANVIGRIRIRSPGLVRGYQDDEDATRASFADGWFMPGDLGRFTPDGQLIFCGRSDHMMIMNGMNLYPEEIERILLSHPEVRDAAVMPLHHPVHQDVPVCAVALSPGARSTEQALLHWAREQLGSRGPHRLWVCDCIPRNPEGKLNRPALSELIRSRMAREHAAQRTRLGPGRSA